MATIKSYTDLEQSKKLAEILPLESADMFYTSLNRDYPWIWIDKHLMEVDDIPCWSLAALLGVLQEVDNNTEFWSDREGWHLANAIYEVCLSNPVDACVEMVELLHKEKLI